MLGRGWSSQQTVMHAAPGRTVSTRNGLANGRRGAFRRDLSGTGDAGGPEEETDRDMYSRQVLEDARLALAFLRDHYGARRFVVIGLCSGGYTGFHAALVEPEVEGRGAAQPPDAPLDAGHHGREQSWIPDESRSSSGKLEASRTAARRPAPSRRSYRG